MIYTYLRAPSARCHCIGTRLYECHDAVPYDFHRFRLLAKIGEVFAVFLPEMRMSSSADLKQHIEIVSFRYDYDYQLTLDIEIH